MKYKLPKVTLVGLALAALLASPAQPEEPPNPGSGQQLVAQAARNLAQQPSVECKLRHSVQLLGKFIVGSGSYRQLTIGDRQMFRLEMKLKVSDRLTSLLEVSDGTTLWIRRGLGDEPRLAYVHLGRIREASRQGKMVIGAQPAAHLALGGLHQLLRGLNDCFEFGAPVPDVMDDQPVWKLTGHWKKDKLVQLLPQQDADTLRGGPAALAKLPPHLPHRVTLLLGRDDQIPLFPYRIEYHRLSEAPTPSTTAPSKTVSYQPVAKMDLFEVRRYVNLDPHHFKFQPNDEQVEDRTEVFLRRLGLVSESGDLR